MIHTLKNIIADSMWAYSNADASIGSFVEAILTGHSGVNTGAIVSLQCELSQLNLNNLNC